MGETTISIALAKLDDETKIRTRIYIINKKNTHSVYKYHLHIMKVIKHLSN